MLKTFADDLKSIREEKNISLRTISQQTRLNIAILENLESGDFTFQPQTYIRAFLKQYINSLGLDMEETLFDYDLARSGKYKAKRPPASYIKNPPADIEQKQITDDKSKITEKLKEIASTPKTEEKKIEKPLSSIENDVKSSELNYSSGKKPEGKLKIKPDDEKKSGQSLYSNRKNIVASFLNMPVVRNIILIIFIGLVLLGIYSLINILFLEGSKDKPDIIRQNFDEVVKEQERKLLGKRSPEEIQDSIRKAEQEAASFKDSITLKVTALSSGSFSLVTDSLNFSKPDKIEFEKNQTGVFKAKKFFHISSGNTATFKATINDIPLKFDKLSVSKVKITGNGIVK